MRAQVEYGKRVGSLFRKPNETPGLKVSATGLKVCQRLLLLAAAVFEFLAAPARTQIVAPDLGAGPHRARIREGMGFVMRNIHLG